MGHYVDRYRNEIAEHSQVKELARAGKAAFDEFKQASQLTCERNGVLSGALIDPEPAHGLLQEMHSRLVENLETRVSGYSSLRWLFMLRRLPDYVFAGQLISTIGYDSALAEVLSARSTLVEQIRRQDASFFFHIDVACVRRLLRFCEGIRTLSQLHVLARWCGKGASLRIAKDWLPRAEKNGDIRAAVELYDRRCDVERSAWGRRRNCIPRG